MDPPFSFYLPLLLPPPARRALSVPFMGGPSISCFPLLTQIKSRPHSILLLPTPLLFYAALIPPPARPLTHFASCPAQMNASVRRCRILPCYFAFAWAPKPWPISESGLWITSGPFLSRAFPFLESPLAKTVIPSRVSRPLPTPLSLTEHGAVNPESFHPISRRCYFTSLPLSLSPLNS